MDTEITIQNTQDEIHKVGPQLAEDMNPYVSEHTTKARIHEVRPHSVVNMNLEASVQTTQDEIHVPDESSEDSSNMYWSALRIFEEEQLERGATRCTRRMKRKRIQEIMADWIDPG